MPEDGAVAPNHLTLFLTDDGTLTYALESRKTGRATGKIELNKPLTTGWADWQLTVDRTMPHAEEWMDFIPTTPTATCPDLPDGIRIRIERRGEISDPWVSRRMQISVAIASAAGRA